MQTDSFQAKSRAEMRSQLQRLLRHTNTLPLPYNKIIDTCFIGRQTYSHEMNRINHIASSATLPIADYIDACQKLQFLYQLKSSIPTPDMK